MKPMFQELFYNQQKFPKGWSPLSDHSNIPISTQVIRIHLRLFWLHGITWQTGPTFQELFYDQKSFLKVGPPSQIILRYLSLLRVPGFTCACSGYLGSPIFTQVIAAKNPEIKLT